MNSSNYTFLTYVECWSMTDTHMSGQPTEQLANTQKPKTRLNHWAKRGKNVQEVIGMFLYYRRCVDTSMLPALVTLATQQASPTKNTMNKIKQFLDYAATHLDAVVIYHASDMVLAGHSDSLYRSESNAWRRARAGGNFSCLTMWRHHPTTAWFSQYLK